MVTTWGYAFAERYDARLARYFGPSPRAARAIDFSAAPQTAPTEV